MTAKRRGRAGRPPWPVGFDPLEDAAISFAVQQTNSDAARSDPFPRPIYEVPAIMLLVAIACILVRQFVPFVAMAENWIHDLRIARLTQAIPQHAQIAIVTITEETLTAFPYRSPLDRRFLGKLLRDLERKGARLVGIDVLFDQPTEPAKDAELKQTLRNLGMPVVVARVDRGLGLSKAQTAYMEDYLDGEIRAPVQWEDGSYTAPWPAEIPVRDGDSYELRFTTTAKTERLDIHLIPKDLRGDARRAVWMHRQGCARQAKALLGSMG